MPQDNHSHNETKQRILVIKLGALGDFIQALGAMKAIKEHHKNAHITLLTTKPFHNFAQKCGYFDNIILDKRPKLLDFGGWLSLKRTLNNLNITRVYDLQNNNRTGIYFKLFPRKNKPEWVGIAKGASHRNTSPERTKGLAFYGHKQTLSLAGVNNVEIDTLDWINEDLTKFALKKPYILLIPGSAPQHPHKRWPAKNYAALANELINNGFQIVLLGTDAEKDVTNEIEKLCPEITNFTGKTTLFEIAALAHNAAAAIGNDTGPMHIIGPTNCPTLVLFSEHSLPHRHAPLGTNVKTIQEKNIAAIEVSRVLKTNQNMIKA